MSVIDPVPGGFAIFCDDVRLEATGKYLIIGGYDNQMIIFGQAPITLPQLCVHVRFRENTAAFPRPITFLFTKHTRASTEEIGRIEMNAEGEAKALSYPENLGDGQPFVGVGLTHRFEGLEFAEEAKLRVRALVGDDEIWLGSLQVSLQEPPVDAQAASPA